MKKLVLSTLLLSVLSGHASAQDAGPDEQTQKMSNKVAEATACMSKVDMNYLQQLSEKQKPHKREVKKLCEAGKRNQAQAKAEILKRKFLADPEVKKANECTAILGRDDDDKNNHICDDL